MLTFSTTNSEASYLGILTRDISSKQLKIYFRASLDLILYSASISSCPFKTQIG